MPRKENEDICKRFMLCLRRILGSYKCEGQQQGLALLCPSARNETGIPVRVGSQRNLCSQRTQQSGPADAARQRLSAGLLAEQPRTFPSTSTRNQGGSNPTRSSRSGSWYRRLLDLKSKWLKSLRPTTQEAKNLKVLEFDTSVANTQELFTPLCHSMAKDNIPTFPPALRGRFSSSSGTLSFSMLDSF